jgi:hypothetical protein
LQLVHLPGWKLRPCWSETPAWGFPLACHRVGRLRCPPAIGQDTFVTGRSLRVDMLKPETPVLRGQRLWSVWLGSGMRLGLDGSVTSPELGRRLWSLAKDFGLWPETPALESLRAETPALLAGDSGLSQPATATFRGGLYKAFFYL